MPFAQYFTQDPFSCFYNLDGFSSVALTTDIDWAPDYAVEATLRLVDAAGFPITAFATHRTAVLRGLGPAVEIGLHPDNTRPDPVHRFSRKLPDLLEMYPEAKGLRCHRNFFGQNISDLATDAGLLYDASMFLWRQPFAQCYVDYNGLVKIPYTWEDGIHVDLNRPLDIAELQLDTPGLKILNVHPMLIYLNAPNDRLRRSACKGITDLAVTPEAHFSDSIFKGYGLARFFADLLSELRRRQVRPVLLRDIAALKPVKAI